MRRGTTPTLKFTTPYTADKVDGGYITFVQRGSIVFDKEIPGEGVTIADNVIRLELSQAETLKFTTADDCKVQLRLIVGGGRVASNVVRFPVCEILKEGEI